MTRVWYNKSFSFVHAMIQLIKQADTDGEFYLIASHTQHHARALLVADEAYLEPAGLVGQAYVSWCLAFCQQHQIDIFVVGKEAICLADYQAEFLAQGTRLLVVASSETLTLLDDKAAFAQQLPPDIAVLPTTISVNNGAQFQAAYQHLRQQFDTLCVKPSQSIFGLGFRVIDEQRDCLQHILAGDEYIVSFAELTHAIQQHSEFKTLLVMEYLNGDEWSVDCLAEHGQLWSAIQRRKPMQKGQIPHQVIDNNPLIAAMTARLTQHLQLNGQFNVQYRQGAHGIKLLEINARPSGGMAMACLAGVNLPYLLLKGLVCGYAQLQWPVPQVGMTVGEVSQALVLTAPTITQHQ
ncbi:ATP-grasp domain-containing protein [Agitococcus lubricus]|uniref:ATP-grasp domain-containing protein n=1 Tax=Agitococcus lubricus TaxID=1077255 RepID=A0A2T5J2P4_9GAMM|nr:ATP-grasp domain-containing protein [Agitococcus lubricus]PTQ90757.1 ATP-grasp domain-containing protein [Agitococcus lubricus]